jgi:hypothetical protein
MVNIKYYINGEKSLDNEYQFTNYSNFNDIYSKIKHGIVYKVLIRRIYDKTESLEQTIYLIIRNNKLYFYDINCDIIYSKFFCPTASQSSRWKIYLNEASNLAILHITYFITDLNNGAKITRKIRNIILDQYYNMDNIFLNSKYITQIDKIILNDQEISLPKYEDLAHYNEITIYTTCLQDSTSYETGYSSTFGYSFCNIL